MKAILLCAGFGTRLYPLTINKAKPLLTVAGKPIVEHLIDQLAATGHIDSFVIVSNGKFAEDFNVWANGRFQVISDGSMSNDTRLGTVRDLSYAIEKESLAGATIIAAGDNLFRFDFENFFDDYFKNPRNLILRYREDDKKKLRRTGVVGIEKDGKVISFEEKPKRPLTKWACPAFYLLETEGLNSAKDYLLENPEADSIGSFIGWLSNRMPVFTHEMRGSRLDIGDIEGYRNANSWMIGDA